MRHPLNDIERQRYVLRLMAATAGTLLVLVLLVRFWPLPSGDGADDRVYDAQSQLTIEMEEIVQTRQSTQAPPPPPPVPPVPVPDDVVIEEEEFDLADIDLPTLDPGEAPEFEEGPDDTGTPSSLAATETAPKPVRIVEPEFPRAARRKGVRAEVVVRVLVDARGRVQETEIVERFLLSGRDDAREAVGEIGYGVEESVLAAAERWLFRPARKGGQAVTSYTTFTLSIGVQ